MIAHSGDANKASLAAELGAEHSLHCAMDDLAEQVLSLTGGDGVRSVFDGVGVASWAASLRSVGRRGMIATFGNASGPVPPFTAIDLMRAGSVFVTRPTLSDYCATAEEMQGSARRLFEVITSGAVQVRVGQTFPLSCAAEAHRALEQRATTGSTLIIPDS